LDVWRKRRLRGALEIVTPEVEWRAASNDWQRRTLNEFRVQGNYRPTAKFSISASEVWDRFRLPLMNGKFSVLLAG
jgi:hypothetical protein